MFNAHCHTHTRCVQRRQGRHTGQPRRRGRQLLHGAGEGAGAEVRLQVGQGGGGVGSGNGGGGGLE